MANARTPLHIFRPFLRQTERGWLNRWAHLDVYDLGSPSAYLHGLVIPAVGPVLLLTAAVQHQQSPVGVGGLQAAGLVQTQHTDAALDQGQGVPVGLICVERRRVVIENKLLIKTSGSEKLRPLIRASLACAHSLLPSEVRMPTGGELSSAFSAIDTIFSSWDKISDSLSCLLFATTSNTKN